MNLLSMLADEGQEYSDCIILNRKINYGSYSFEEYLLYIGNKVFAQYIEPSDYDPTFESFESTYFCVFGNCKNSHEKRRVLRFLNVYCGLGFEKYEDVDLSIDEGFLPYKDNYKADEPSAGEVLDYEDMLEQSGYF